MSSCARVSARAGVWTRRWGPPSSSLNSLDSIRASARPYASVSAAGVCVCVSFHSFPDLWRVSGGGSGGSRTGSGRRAAAEQVEDMEMKKKIHMELRDRAPEEVR